MSNPNEMTDAVGTNPDLFCIHAEVPASKEGASNLISVHEEFAIKLSVLSSHDAPTVRQMDQNT